VNTAIGQGDVLVTPIQLANAYATFANGGTRMAPTVVGRWWAETARTIRTMEHGPSPRSTIDPVFANLSLEGLSGVTADPEGTAYWAFNSEATNGVYFPLEEFPVAAKTGTAEVRGKADTSLFAAFGLVPGAHTRHGLQSWKKPASAVRLRHRS
jgi:penicillin-binding protein 2